MAGAAIDTSPDVQFATLVGAAKPDRSMFLFRDPEEDDGIGALFRADHDPVLFRKAGARNPQFALGITGLDLMHGITALKKGGGTGESHGRATKLEKIPAFHGSQGSEKSDQLTFLFFRKGFESLLGILSLSTVKADRFSDAIGPPIMKEEKFASLGFLGKA